MDFDFSPEEQKFAEEVEQWLVENHDPEVMDLTRENFSQLSDTPARRAFMKKLAKQGWLGMSWPKKYGGQEIEGVYEFILTEALARPVARWRAGAIAASTFTNVWPKMLRFDRAAPSEPR